MSTETYLLTAGPDINTGTNERNARLRLHLSLWKHDPAALAVLQRVHDTGQAESFAGPTAPVQVSAVVAKLAPRRYLAVKLDADNCSNGNPRRGWLVYLDTPDSPLLGWIEEEYMGWAALYSTILRAEDPTANPNPGSRQCADFRDHSGRVRELCSLKVPYSEIREARRSPFKLGGA